MALRRRLLFRSTLVVVAALLASSFASRSALADSSAAATSSASCFTQVSRGGFGNPKNTYAWAMKAFGNYLYVGTLNKAAVGGLGSLDAPQSSSSLLRPTAHSDVTGTQIWRFDGTTWTQVVSDGFGSKNNQGTRNFAIYNNAIYAGTLNPLGGAEVWSSSDGLTWTQVAKNGIGNVLNSSIRGMTVWRGKLWVGTVNQLGGEVWNYDGTTWTKVAARGINHATNDTISDLRIYQDQLYAGTWNGRGAEMYRYDGTTWTQLVGGSAVTPTGFGDVNNTGIFTIIDFHGALYASTRNFSTGFMVYRSQDLGSTWQPVVSNGFGDATQRYGWRMFVWNDQLFLGTFVSGNSGPDQYTLGGRVYRTPDGVTWTEEVGPAGDAAGPGFGNGLNYGVRTFESFFGELYMGTAQCFFCSFPVTGAEVWHRNASACPP